MLLSCYLMLKRVFKPFPLLSRRGHLGGVNEAHGPYVRFDLKTHFCEIRVRTRVDLLFKFLPWPSLSGRWGNCVPVRSGVQTWPSLTLGSDCNIYDFKWGSLGQVAGRLHFSLLSGIYSADACQSGTKCLSSSPGSFARLPLSLEQWFQSVISGTGCVNVTWDKLNQKIWRWIQLSVVSINPPGDS